MRKELMFTNDSAALDRLAKAQNAIDDYSAAHPGAFSEAERQEFGMLLRERASALSEATRMNIHAIADDN